MYILRILFPAFTLHSLLHIYLPTLTTSLQSKYFPTSVDSKDVLESSRCADWHLRRDLRVWVSCERWTRLQGRAQSSWPWFPVSGMGFIQDVNSKTKHTIFRNKHSTTWIVPIFCLSCTKYSLWNHFYLTASRVRKDIQTIYAEGTLWKLADMTIKRQILCITKN